MDVNALVVLGHSLLATKYYYLATMAVILYDMFLTLGDEIHFGWNSHKKTYACYLVLFNRYFAACSAIITNVAYFLPQFTPKICDKWVIFLGFQYGVTVIVAEAIMMLRVYAMSGRNRVVIYALGSYLIVQVIYGIAMVALPGNTGLPVPGILGVSDAFHICIFSPANITADVVFLYMALVFDITVFAMTLVHVSKSTQSSNPKHLMHVVSRDGMLYFIYVFSCNILLVVCVGLRSELPLKYLQAAPSLLLIPVMISRLALSLHKANQKDLSLGTSRYSETHYNNRLATFSTVCLPE